MALQVANRQYGPMRHLDLRSREERHGGDDMSVGRRGEPIKLGILQDFTIDRATGYDTQQDFLDSFALVFREAEESGLLDRSVELVERNANGLPIGNVKSVIDA
jgi:branched-chain amino acid transport system substrate-binding protein